MTNNRKELKNVISKQLDQIRLDISELEEHTKPIAPENAIGRLSRMDAINNKTINDAALREKKKRLAQLEDALARSDMEDFGTCKRCKQQIPLGRLMYMPESNFCVACS